MGNISVPASVAQIVAAQAGCPTGVFDRLESLFTVIARFFHDFTSELSKVYVLLLQGFALPAVRLPPPFVK